MARGDASAAQEAQRIAWFDPFSGASGDMVLGALLDCGVEPAELRGLLAGLSLGGYELRVERISQHGIGGTRVNVVVEGEQPERDWAEIRALLDAAELPDAVRRGAVAVFSALAEAEARVHAVPV